MAALGVRLAGSPVLADGEPASTRGETGQTGEDDPARAGASWPVAPARPVRWAGTSAVPVYSQLEVEALIRHLSGRYGIDPDRNVLRAWRESRFDQFAVSPAGHKGIFQFSDRTWAWASAMAGFPGANVFDAPTNIEVACWLLAYSGPGGGPRSWPNT